MWSIKSCRVYSVCLQNIDIIPHFWLWHLISLYYVLLLNTCIGLIKHSGRWSLCIHLLCFSNLKLIHVRAARALLIHRTARVLPQRAKVCDTEASEIHPQAVQICHNRSPSTHMCSAKTGNLNLYEPVFRKRGLAGYARLGSALFAKSVEVSIASLILASYYTPFRIMI